METAFFESPLGIVAITGDQNGVSKICIDEEGTISRKVPKDLILAITELNEYFDKKRTHFTFKINLQGTDFQKNVWELLLTVPFGKTLSYLDLSKKLGNIKAIRAVAAANGKNPLWIVVPCHRIIGSNGELVGYAGGLWRKKWLLEHESLAPQQSLF
jgi:methylated-DNA-[protein]-cysteine S-methyltransferase